MRDAEPARTPPSRALGSTRRRRRVLLAVAGVVVALGLVLVAFGLQLRAARSHLISGAHILDGTRAALDAPAQMYDPGLRHRLRSDIGRAEGEFASARSDLFLWSPVLPHLGWVPRIGNELTLASPTADAAYFSTSSAVSLLDGLEPVWRRASHGAHRKPWLTVIEPILERSGPDFASARSDADSAAAALGSLPVHSGSSTLDRATARLRDKLPVIRSASHWLAVLPTILGADRPRHYLIALQNPAQIRATGGFLGSEEWVTLSHGSMTTTFSSSELPHETTAIPPLLPEAMYSPEGAWIFRDSNWSPHFPLTARLERWFFGEDTGRWADGVINAVDTVIAPILRVTGPVYVPAYGRWVTAANAQAIANEYVNSGYHGPSQSGSADTRRKQFFGYVIPVLLRRIEALPVERWPALGGALADIISRRDIMLYDRDAAIERSIAMSGADGAFVAPPGDFLAIVDTNLSYNKINPYVDERARYHARILADGSMRATLRLRYHVSPSPQNLEGWGPGSGVWGTKHDYQDFLRVFVPAGATLGRTSGIDPWAPSQAYGITQFAGRLLIRSGQTRTVTIEYRIPAHALAALHFTTYALTIRHQPGAALASVPVTIDGGPGITFGAARARSVHRVLTTTADAHLSIPLRGISHPRLRPLPPRWYGDPFVPYSYFRDGRHPL